MVISTFVFMKKKIFTMGNHNVNLTKKLNILSTKWKSQKLRVTMLIKNTFVHHVEKLENSGSAHVIPQL